MQFSLSCLVQLLIIFAGISPCITFPVSVPLSSCPLVDRRRSRHPHHIQSSLDSSLDKSSKSPIEQNYNIPYRYISYLTGIESNDNDTVAVHDPSSLDIFNTSNTNQLLHILSTWIYRVKYRFTSVASKMFRKNHGGRPKFPLRSMLSSSFSNLEYLNVNWEKIKADHIVPMLAIVNRKSGGLKGERALDNLQKVLNNIQICDLSENDPSDFFKFYKNSSPHCDLKIICCGGDGTIGWIMDEVYSAGLYDGRNISFALIPFGTGNDLFTHMSSLADDKSKFYREMNADALVSKTQTVLGNLNRSDCPAAQLDRWSVAITPKMRRLRKLLISSLSKKSPSMETMDIDSEDSDGLESLDSRTVRLSTRETKVPVAQATVVQAKSNASPTIRTADNTLVSAGKQVLNTVKNLAIPLRVRVGYRRMKYRALKELKRGRIAKVKVLNNYFGIGVDGAVAMSFSELRRQMPVIFFHSIVNKIWYAIMGFIAFLFHRRLDLRSSLELKCDGKACEIPIGTQGVIIANIGSYAGGSKLWPFDNDRWKEQHADDGMIEVVAVTGVFHLGQIKTGLATATPIAQGRSLQIVTKSRLPMQIDGEPWSQRTCKININLRER
jgi:hypothetical protein